MARPPVLPNVPALVAPATVLVLTVLYVVLGVVVESLVTTPLVVTTVRTVVVVALRTSVVVESLVADRSCCWFDIVTLPAAQVPAVVPIFHSYRR